MAASSRATPASDLSAGTAAFSGAPTRNDLADLLADVTAGRAAAPGPPPVT